MDGLSSLHGTSLVVVAHPDDECVTYGALLQRAADPVVLFLTEGAPRDPYFWQRYGSREAYARLRREETRRALAHIGVSRFEFAADAPGSEALVDQELFRVLPQAWDVLAEAVERLRPEALLTLAYEGGHPDHDSCNLLVSVAARRFRLPAWEAPIYHRAWASTGGNPCPQTFIASDGSEIDVNPTPDEIARKGAMWSEYASQGDFMRIFSPSKEIVRPLAACDYSCPPHPGKLNYEHWQWPMTGSQVSEAFREFLAAEAALTNQIAAPGSYRK